jgi:hypothetical protein
MLKHIIFNKSIEIANNLNLNYHNLPRDSSAPQIRKECHLQLKSNLILFLLFSQNSTREAFSGIKIVVCKPTYSDFLAKSMVGLTTHDNLIQLLAYLEVAIMPTTDDADLKRGIISLSYTHGDLLEFQVFSRLVELGEVKDIGFRIRIYINAEEKNVRNRYLEIRDTTNLRQSSQ